MEEAITAQPDILLQQGVAAHIAGDFEQAIKLREVAARMVGMHDPRYPGIQSTIGLAYDRLGMHEAAITATRMAYDMVEAQLRPNATTSGDARRQLEHDRPSIEMHLGAVAARATARAIVDGRTFDPQQFTMARTMLDNAQKHQAEQRQKTNSRRLHQWDINMTRRRAGAIAMDRETSTYKGLGMGLQALWRGAFSESPWFVDGTSNVRGKQKLQAKAKAMLGGAAASAQCALMLIPSKSSKRAAARIGAGRAVF